MLWSCRRFQLAPVKKHPVDAGMQVHHCYNMSDLSLTSLQNWALQGTVSPPLLQLFWASLNCCHHIPHFVTVWHFALVLGEEVRPATSSLPVSHVLSVQQEEWGTVLLACSYWLTLQLRGLLNLYRTVRLRRGVQLCGEHFGTCSVPSLALQNQTDRINQSHSILSQSTTV